MAHEAGLRLLARIEQQCQADADAGALTLRLTLLDVLKRAVGFDAYAWLLADPETWVGSAPLADVPAGLVPELPRLIRLKYLTRGNRWTALGAASVGLLRDATGDNPSRSALWEELLAPHGFGDVASVVFADRFGCWGFLELWRSGSGARFGPDEASQLTRVAPVITAALRRTQAATFAINTRPAPSAGPVVLMLSADLAVRAQTPQTAQYLRLLVPPSGDAPPIPASAYNVAAQLLAREAGIDAHPPSARVHLSDGLWVTLRAARTEVHSDDPQTSTSSDIAVTIEATPPMERAAVFALANGLGNREREVLGHLLSGHDTRETARRMGLSEHTVQDHVKSIFTKTRTNTRAALVSRAIGS